MSCCCAFHLIVGRGRAARGSHALHDSFSVIIKLAQWNDFFTISALWSESVFADPAHQPGFDQQEHHHLGKHRLGPERADGEEVIPALRQRITEKESMQRVTAAEQRGRDQQPTIDWKAQQQDTRCQPAGTCSA